MRGEFDLTQRHFTFRRGMMTMYGTWMRWGNEYQAGIAFVRTGEDYHEFTQPYFIPIGAAAYWAEDSADPQMAFLQGVEVLRNLRLEAGGRRALNRLRIFIQDHLDDMLKIPPFPPLRTKLPILGEAKLVDRDSSKTFELEIPYV